ncbi:MAG: hypothetical protein ABIV26_00160, partial [Candidatus Limnocylindrales bacterium]
MTTSTWPARAVSFQPAPLALATLSMGAAAIHFAVISEHLSESILFGVFFAVLASLEALWALGYLIRPGRVLALGALAGNAATVALWAWAHLLGLPFGPQAGHLEPTTITDLMATAFEV